MSSSQTVGKNISVLLNQYGVDTVFGIPGVHNVEMFRSVEDLGMNFILPRHEQGSAFMADGYARSSGRPGVCFSISGPGVTNSLTALGQSYSDSVPVMMISSSLSREHDHKDHGHLHAMKNQECAVSTVSGLCMTADSENDIEEFCSLAFSMFQTGRPRPAYLQVPIDLMNSPTSRQTAARELPEPPAAAPKSLDKAAAILAASNRTVILAGGGAMNVGPQLLELAVRLQAAVVTTIAGKGIVSEDHPRTLGAALQQTATHQFLQSADVVLVIGSELGSREFWCDSLPFGGEVIRIDIDSNTLAGHRTSHLPIISDARYAIDGLLSRLTDALSGISEAEITKLKAVSQVEARAQNPSCDPLLGCLDRVFPRNAILASDMTMPAYLGSQVYKTYEPRSWLHPNGFGTLGYALPAAIGAKFGAPERPVAALAGDYGFQFTMQELAVAVQHALPIPVIIWNNDSLYAIKDEMVRRQITPTSVTCLNPDFCMLAEAMGAKSARPETYESLEAAITLAFAENVPTLIEARADVLNR